MLLLSVLALSLAADGPVDPSIASSPSHRRLAQPDLSGPIPATALGGTLIELGRAWGPPRPKVFARGFADFERLRADVGDGDAARWVRLRRASELEPVSELLDRQRASECFFIASPSTAGWTLAAHGRCAPDDEPTAATIALSELEPALAAVGPLDHRRAALALRRGKHLFAAGALTGGAGWVVAAASGMVLWMCDTDSFQDCSVTWATLGVGALASIVGPGLLIASMSKHHAGLRALGSERPIAGEVLLAALGVATPFIMALAADEYWGALGWTATIALPMISSGSLAHALSRRLPADALHAAGAPSPVDPFAVLDAR